MRSVIIDASVALKWFVEEKDGEKGAEILINEAQRGEIQFVVPELWLYELTNALKTSVTSKRLSLKRAKNAIKDLLELKLVIIEFKSIIDLTFKLSLSLGISVYDAAYLALAKSQNFPFYSSDQKLLTKIPSNFKQVYNLADLQTEAN